MFLLLKLISFLFDVHAGGADKFIALLLKSLAIKRVVNMVHFTFRNSRRRLGLKLRFEIKITAGL